MGNWFEMRRWVKISWVDPNFRVSGNKVREDPKSGLPVENPVAAGFRLLED